MATKLRGSCNSCGYPIAVDHIGEEISCPYCTSINEAIAQGITIPTWLLALGVGLGVGIIAGPAIMATTETGQKWLEKQVRERVR